MKPERILLLAALLLPSVAQASVADEVAALERAKAQQGVRLPIWACRADRCAARRASGHRIP